MPILSECNFSKIYLLSFKNRKRKNYEQEIKTNNQEIKKTKLIHNKNVSTSISTTRRYYL